MANDEKLTKIIDKFNDTCDNLYDRMEEKREKIEDFIEKFQEKYDVVMDYFTDITDKACDNAGDFLYNIDENTEFKTSLAIMIPTTIIVAVVGTVSLYSYNTTNAKNYYEQNPISTVAEKAYSEDEVYVVYNSDELHYCVSEDLEDYSLFFDINDSNFVCTDYSFKYKKCELKEYYMEHDAENYDAILESMGIVKVEGKTK